MTEILRRRRRMAGSPHAVALIAAALAAASFAAAPMAQATSNPRIVIGSSGAIGRGATLTATPATLSFSVVLAPSHPVELHNLLTAVSTPGSPQFRHFLAPGEFARRFAPAASARQRVAGFFSGYGLHVEASSANSLALSVTGSPANVQRAFGAQLVSLRRANGSIATQFNGTATLPSDVSHAITGVGGLSSWHAAHNHLALAPRGTFPVVSTPGTCPGQSSEASLATQSFTASREALAYGANRQWANGVNGLGTTIAIVELSTYNASDLSTYFSCVKLSPSISIVKVDGGPVGVDISDGGKQEAGLDIEQSAALAPGATILVYEAPNFSNDMGGLDVYGRIAADDRAGVVTTSWGMCEIATGQLSAINTEKPYFDQMALQGQSVTAASGDGGSTDCQDSSGNFVDQLAVDDPASQPAVTGIGGLTVFSIASTSPVSALSQRVWNDGSSSGGGGESTVWTKPAWQSAPGVPVANHRAVPDLSVAGDPGTGFIGFTLGGWGQLGGTSMGSPLVAALIATANQDCGQRLGNINPTLYAMATAGHGFNDVTVGSNALFGMHVSGQYHAGVGYDMASGLGSPDPATFIPSLCVVQPSAANSSVVSSATPADLATGATVTVTIKDAAGVAIPGVKPVISLNSASGTPSAFPTTPTTNASGVIKYTVSASTVGTITFRARLADTALGTASVVVNSSVAIAARALASLGVPSGMQHAAATGPTTPVVVGVNGAGHVVASSGAGVVTDFTSKFHLSPAAGAPAVDCSGASCVALVTVSGRLVEIVNVNSPATSGVTNIGATNPPAAAVISGTLSLSDHRGAGYFDATFLNPAHHVMLAHYVVATHKFTFTDLSAKYALGYTSNAAPVVSYSASQRYLAVRVGATFWLVSDGTVHTRQNVTSTGYVASGATALTGTPNLVRDPANGQLELLGRTGTGAVVVFLPTAALPGKLATYQVVAPSGANGAALIADVTSPLSADLVAITGASGLQVITRVAGSALFSVPYPAPATLSTPSIVTGVAPLVLSSGVYYALTP